MIESRGSFLPGGGTSNVFAVSGSSQNVHVLNLKVPTKVYPPVRNMATLALESNIKFTRTNKVIWYLAVIKSRILSYLCISCWVGVCVRVLDNCPQYLVVI